MNLGRHLPANVECLQELRASTAWWRWICPFVSPLFMRHFKPHQLTLHFLETKETIVQRSQLEPQIFLALGDLTCHLLAHLGSSEDQARSLSPRLPRNSEPHGRPRVFCKHKPLRFYFFPWCLEEPCRAHVKC